MFVVYNVMLYILLLQYTGSMECKYIWVQLVTSPTDLIFSGTEISDPLTGIKKKKSLKFGAL